MKKYDEKQREDDETSIEDLCRMLEEYRDAFDNKEIENSSLKMKIRDLQYENKVIKLADSENTQRIRFLEDSLAQVVQDIDDLQTSLEKKQEECVSLTKQLRALEANKVSKLEDDTYKQDILIAELRKENEALKLEIAERDEIIYELDDQLNMKESEMLDLKLEGEVLSIEGALNISNSDVEHKNDNESGKPGLIKESKFSSLKSSPPPKPNKTKKWKDSSLSPQSKQSNGKANRDFNYREKTGIVRENNSNDRLLSEDDSYYDDKMDSEFAAAVLHANNSGSTGLLKGFSSQIRKDPKFNETKYRHYGNKEPVMDGLELQEPSRMRYVSKAVSETTHTQLEENLNSSTIVSGRHRYVGTDHVSHPPLPPPPPPPPQHTAVESDRGSTVKGNEGGTSSNLKSIQKPSSKGGQIMDTLSRILYPTPQSNHRTLSAVADEDLKEGDESPVRGKLYSIYAPSSDYSNLGLEEEEEECKNQYYAHPMRSVGNGNKSDDDHERAGGGTSSPDGFPTYAVRKRAVVGSSSNSSSSAHPFPVVHRSKDRTSVDIPPGPSFSTPKTIPSKK